MELKLWTFDFSPYCLPVKRVLEAAKIPYQEIVLPPWDKRPLIEATQGAYAQVPLIQAGETFIYESGDTTQDVARFLDEQYLSQRLFPKQFEGIQELMCRHLEEKVEFHVFRLNDCRRIPLMQDLVGKHLLIMNKERKFGKNCVDNWRKQEAQIFEHLVDELQPYEKILSTQSFLVQDKGPVFADFLLFGMLANLTFGNLQEIPRSLPQIRTHFHQLETFEF